MQKFVITSDNRLKYGDVNMHYQLLDAGESCIGGGMYEFDRLRNAMMLYGKSYDFGRPKWSWVDTLYVPESLRGLELYYEDLPVSHFVSEICYY